MYLQSVEEARPVKASEVGEQMEAEEVDILENEKKQLFTNPYLLFLEGQ